MNPFDFVNAINDTKKNLMVGTENDELAEKGYTPFMVNKSLSYFVDTILYANEMNLHHSLDKDMQYSFYLNSLRKKKRFSPWLRKDKVNDLECVKKYYGYSNEKASQALKILSKDQINFIKQRLDIGGRK